MRIKFAVPLVMIFLLVLSVPVLAGDIQVRAFLDETTAEVGQQLTLTVAIEGAINVDPPAVQIPGCQVEYYGPSTQVSVVNGSRSMAVSHIYVVVPTQAGTIEVPAIGVRVKGRAYQTAPFRLTVQDANQNYGGYNQSTSQNQSSQSQSSQGNQGYTGTSSSQNQSSNGLEQRHEGSSDKIFLVVEPAKTKAYVHEPIPVTVKLYFRRDQELKNIHYPEMKLNNFLLDQFSEPDQLTEVVNGAEYNVFPFKTVIRPVAPGNYKIGPVTLNADVVTQSDDNLSAFDSFFGSDYKLSPVNLTAKTVNIQVLDFPVAGKPADFNGAIGQFNMEVSINPQDVRAGEPVTVRITISGNGNFDSITAPVLDKNPNFKYYDPQEIKRPTGQASQSSTAQHEKVYEQVVIPTTEVEKLPGIHLSYFDPADQKYHTMQYGPTAIRVSSSKDSKSPRQVADYRDGEKSDQVLGEDIVYIKANPGKLHQAGKGLMASPVFIGYNTALALALAGGLVWRRKRNQETPADRRKKAIIAETMQLLMDSEKLITERKITEFYNTVYQAVQNYLKEYYQIAITGISDYEADHLLKAGLSAGFLNEIKDFYRQIDEKRFAGNAGSASDMEQILKKAREIVARIQKGEVA